MSVLRLGLQRPRYSWPSRIASIAHSTPSPRYNPTVSTTSSTPASAERQTVKLPDGRLLGFAEYGKPDGKPLFYFHGYPASRREIAPISKDANKRGIRLISIDRPGIGASTFQSGRKLRDWPDDVRTLADTLGLDRFAVLGSSGGGPYAIACALALPPQRLSVAGVFAGAPPWEFGAQHMSLPRRRLAYLAEHWPRSLEGLTATLVSISRWLLHCQWIQNKIDAWLVAVINRANENEGKPVETLSCEKLTEIREQTIGPFLDHFEQGAAGFVKETQVLVGPWGFPFEEVRGRVQIYHGAKDANAPPQMMRILAQRLPNCDLQELEKDDHYTMGRHMADAMEKLVSDKKRTRI
ncbi:hypothetical protein NLU13_8967 [Sarocladium strictum]|uniref:AB hydrolase-1 domain-containing protein n=1 Tax=Sarocladium strictum TaxID=5046 RepID=A0AA39G9R8_SARSR|nr:hypothetical protein NLU13_8967 [Sarocladium strictum]